MVTKKAATLDHVAEPWHWKYNKPAEEGGVPLVQAEDSTEIAILPHNLDTRNEAHAARIVSCVNACKDLPNSVLDAGLLTEFARATCAVALILPQARAQLKHEIGLIVNSGAPPKFRPMMQAKARQLSGIVEVLLRAELLAVGALALAQKNGLDIQIDDQPKPGAVEG